MTGKLYQTKDGKTFGTHVGTNSEGKLILEVKTGSGSELKPFSPADIEVVIPYTILVTNREYGNRYIQVPKDAGLRVNGVLSFDGMIWVVKQLDTKQPTNDSPKDIHVVETKVLNATEVKEKAA